jgi:AcrR family transcriptional regulator
VAPVGLRERKKARTKAAIQQVALRLFDQHGYATTTVDQIAAAAEVSPSTFFRYFASKEDVVLADFLDSRVVTPLIDAPADRSPIQALRYALHQVFDALPEDEWQLEIMRNQLIQQVPELRRGMISEVARPIDLLTKAWAQRLGRTPDDVSLRVLAAATVGGMLAVGHVLAIPDNRAAGLDQLDDVLDRLDAMLVLPPAQA